MTKKKPDAKTQHKKGEPIRDINRLTTDITKAVRFPDYAPANSAAAVLNDFGLVRSRIQPNRIGDFFYLVADAGGEPCFVADPR